MSGLSLAMFGPRCALLCFPHPGFGIFVERFGHESQPIVKKFATLLRLRARESGPKASPKLGSTPHRFVLRREIARNWRNYFNCSPPDNQGLRGRSCMAVYTSRLARVFPLQREAVEVTPRWRFNIVHIPGVKRRICEFQRDRRDCTIISSLISFDVCPCRAAQDFRAYRVRRI